jgi:hypothetical protein
VVQHGVISRVDCGRIVPSAKKTVDLVGKCLVTIQDAQPNALDLRRLKFQDPATIAAAFKFHAEESKCGVERHGERLGAAILAETKPVERVGVSGSSHVHTRDGCATHHIGQDDVRNMSARNAPPRLASATLEPAMDPQGLAPAEPPAELSPMGIQQVGIRGIDEMVGMPRHLKVRHILASEPESSERMGTPDGWPEPLPRNPLGDGLVPETVEEAIVPADIAIRDLTALSDGDDTRVVHHGMPCLTLTWGQERLGEWDAIGACDIDIRGRWSLESEVLQVVDRVQGMEFHTLA